MKTALHTAAAQDYAVGSFDLSVDLPDGAFELGITFDRISWPEGPCLVVTLDNPDDEVPSGKAEISGGEYRARDGSNTSSFGMRHVAPGRYVFSIDVQQPLRAGVTIWKQEA